MAQLNSYQQASATVFSIRYGTKKHSHESPHQLEILGQVRAGLGIDQELDSVRIFDNYGRGTKLLQKDGSRYEGVMSQYLHNDLVRETFPWTQPTAMEHYRRLLTRYGILRLMLSGVAAGQNVAPNKSKMVETIQVFRRIYQHNNDFAKQAGSLLAESDWAQLERLYLLLS